MIDCQPCFTPIRKALRAALTIAAVAHRNPAKALKLNAHWLETGEGRPDLPSLVGSYDPDSEPRRGVSSTGKGRHKLTLGAIAELESRAGLGGGGYAVTTEVNDEGGAESYTADFIKAERILPPAFLSSELGVSFGFAEIVLVDRDSM